MRNFSIALIIVMAAGSLFPATLGYAQESSGPTPQESAPSSEPVATQSDVPSTNENPGTAGTDGQPADTTVQNGTSGADATPTAPAENGEAGDSANAPKDPPAADGTSAEITTGNASSDSTTTNEGNLTNVTTPPPEGTTYPYGKPPEWFIVMCEKFPKPICDKYIVKPPPTTVAVTSSIGIENTGASVAETGVNSAVDPDGVSIATGNSDAFGYLISLFNIVVTNSNGSILFLKNPLGSALDLTQQIMNIFNNLAGANGDCSLLGCSITDAVFNLITDSTADVTNELVVRSGTGTNSATSTGGVASINTGNASAFGSIVNFGNLQIIDSRYMIILMSNAGNLNGNIVLPGGDFFRQLSSGAKIGRKSSLNTTNGADVTNDGVANAMTGSNVGVASSTQEIAAIDTGKATAESNAINFVNQIGSPVCFVVNVGGAWRGDVVRLPDGFSREKTDFGEIICGAGTNENRPGARDNLRATTTNYAKVLNKALVEATTGANTAIGAAAKIKTGDADAFVQILNVLNQSIIGQDWIFALFTVSGDWKGDLVFGAAANEANIATIIASQMLAAAASGGGVPGGYTSDPDVKITKTASVVKADAPARVDYKITVQNSAQRGALYRAVLADVLKGPDGKRVYARHWNLGTLRDGEEVTVTYTVQYNTDIPYGIYNNTATVRGFRNSSIYVLPNPITPVTSTTTVEIGNPAIKVTPYSAIQCTPLLNGYIKIGGANNPTDVRNLQKFLRDIENESALSEDGDYSVGTIAAVKRFQAKYSSEILEPWGIPEPTGQVYYTTQRKINDLYCVNGDTFPLTPKQIEEMNLFRKRFQQSSFNSVDPVLEGVGRGSSSAPRASAPSKDTVSKGATPEKNKVLLKNAAPKPVSQAGSVFEGFSWIKKLLPFVDAFEL